VLYEELQQRLRAVPGVLSVSYSWRPLLGGGLWTASFHLAGTPKDEQVDTDMMPVGANFFETMRIPRRLGREFGPTDFAQAQRIVEARALQEERVAEALKDGTKALARVNQKAIEGMAPMPAIVNEAFLEKFFPNKNPLGIRFGEREATEADPLASPGWEIIGVVADAKYNNLRRAVQPTTYVPTSGRATSFTLRTAFDPGSFVPEVRGILVRLDKNLPPFTIRTESQQIDQQLFDERLVARLSGFFALLALALACIGLYGLLSYEVTRRTREIGIRMALGAKPSNVLRLIIGHGTALALVGAVLGITVALGVTRFLAALLYQVPAADPLTFLGVSLLFAAVAALACYVPARRATRVDPLVALRYE
jgi:predicted permease